KLSEDEWQSILNTGEPPKPIPEFEQTSHLKNINKSSEFKKKIESATKNSRLVRNEVLGWRSQEVIDEAIRRGAIVKYKGKWSVPTEEEKIYKDGKGNT